MGGGRGSGVGSPRQRETLADLEADETLAEHIDQVRVGRALDLGAGDGDHALWLAARGFEVEVVDTDADALRRAEKRAFRLRLRLQAFLADMAEFPILPATYDLMVAAASLHFLPPERSAALAPHIVAGLAPGGVLYATAFTTDDPGYAALRAAGIAEIAPRTFDVSEGGAPEALRYFAPGELGRLFADLAVVYYAEERYLRPGDGPGYNAAATLVASKRP